MGVGALKAQSAQDTSCPSAFTEVPDSQLHQPHQKNAVQTYCPSLILRPPAPGKCQLHIPFYKVQVVES